MVTAIILPVLLYKLTKLENNLVIFSELLEVMVSQYL